MAPDVSIIIVTYDALGDIDRCLAALLDEGGAWGVSHEVLVVDNASTDGTPEHVAATWGDRVRVIPAGHNGGMAAGNNIGMVAANGRAFLLLNADAFPRNGSLRAMLDTLDASDPGCIAAVVPRLLNVDGSPQCSVRGFPSIWRYATEFLYLRRIAPHSRAFNGFYGGGLDLRQRREIEWATGACLLVPRAAVDEVGLMDEGYFMYGEEVDWLHRMRAAGRVVVWDPGAVVTHVGGGSARRHWGRLYQVQLANHVRYMALREGEGAARSLRALLAFSLGLRAVLWRAASLLPGDRETRRGRANAFAAGRATMVDMDLAAIAPAAIPPWPGAVT